MIFCLPHHLIYLKYLDETLLRTQYHFLQQLFHDQFFLPMIIIKFTLHLLSPFNHPQINLFLDLLIISTQKNLNHHHHQKFNFSFNVYLFILAELHH